MSDVQLLFLVLALIYGWECAWWISRGSSVLRTWFGNRWQLVDAGILLGNRRGGFVFGNPLPPLGTMLNASELPLILSPHGIAPATVPEPGASAVPTGKFLPWEELNHVEVKGKKVLVNKVTFLNADSSVLAGNLSKLILEIKLSKKEVREELIRTRVKRSWETSNIKEKWVEFRMATRSVALAANILFFVLFVLSPIVITVFGFRRSWLGLLIAVFTMTSIIAVLFQRAHKMFYPEAEEERFTHFIIALLSPATAIRVRDVLSRPLFALCHPLVLVKVFCTPEKFRQQAEIHLRQGQFPTRMESERGNSAADDPEQFWQKLRLDELRTFLKRNGLDPQQLLKPPAPLDETCQSYCPRCGAQFTTTKDLCGDCGVALQPLQNAGR